MPELLLLSACYLVVPCAAEAPSFRLVEVIENVIGVDGDLRTFAQAEATITVKEFGSGKVLTRIDWNWQDWGGLAGWTGSVPSTLTGSYIAVPTGFGVRIFDAKRGELLRTVRFDDQGVFALSFLPDGNQLLVVGGKRLSLLNMQDRAEKLLLEKPYAHGHIYAVAGDGSILALCVDKAVDFFDVNTGKSEGRLSLQERALAVALSLDKKRLAVGDKSDSIKIVDRASQRTLLSLEGHADEIRALAYHSKEWLASFAADDTLRLWDTKTGRQIQKLNLEGKSLGIAKFPTILRFSSDGRKLVLLVGDNTPGTRFRMKCTLLTLAEKEPVK